MGMLWNFVDALEYFSIPVWPSFMCHLSSLFFSQSYTNAFGFRADPELSDTYYQLFWALQWRLDQLVDYNACAICLSILRECYLTSSWQGSYWNDVGFKLGSMKCLDLFNVCWLGEWLFLSQPEFSCLMWLIRQLCRSSSKFRSMDDCGRNYVVLQSRCMRCLFCSLISMPHRFGTQFLPWILCMGLD